MGKKSKKTLCEQLKILERALELLEKKRWIKGTLLCMDSENNVVGVCALGAIHETGKAMGIDDYNSAVNMVATQIDKQGRFSPSSTITSFNDSPKTKKVDVIGVFKKAIASVEQQIRGIDR